MESIDPVLLVGVVALICGVLIGMLISRISSPSSGDVDALKAELERERTEMARYRASVDEHFNKTSDLVNDLTQDYVKVYRHLAEGAQTLSGVSEFNKVLEQPQGRVLISVDEFVTEAEASTTTEASGEAPSEPSSSDTPEQTPLDDAPKDYVENAPEPEADMDSASDDSAARETSDSEPVDDTAVDKAASVDSDEPEQTDETRDSSDSTDSEIVDAQDKSDELPTSTESHKAAQTADADASSEKKI